MHKEKEIERYLTIEKNGELVAVDNPEYVKKIQVEKYEYFLNKSNIPVFYHSISFADYVGQKHNEEFRKIKYYAEHCHEDKFKYVSLYLWGEGSTQKTALSCNIGKQAIKSGLRVKFIQASTLIDRLLKVSSYSRDEKIEEEISELKEQDLLILDDVGDLRKGIMFKNNPDLIITEWDNFLRPLLANGMKIVFTSNNSIDVLKEIFCESLFELLHRNCECIHLLDSVKQKRKLNVSSVFEGV
jgi:DNA replication protein DnaC